MGRVGLCRTLAAGVINGILPGEDHLGDGYKGISLLEQALDDIRKGFRGMEGGVVEQDNGAGLHPAGDPLGDLTGGNILPVQAVHIPLNGLHADGAHGVDGAIVIVPVGETNQGRPHAGNRLNFVVAGVQIGHHLLRGELRVVGVGVGVVHDLMPGIREGFD